MKSKIGIILGVLIIIILAVVGVIAYKNNKQLEIVEKFVNTNIAYDLGSNYKMTMTRNGTTYTTYYKEGKAKLVSTGTSTYTYYNKEKTYVIIEDQKKYIVSPIETKNSGKTNLIPSLGYTDRSGNGLDYYAGSIKNVYKDGEDKYCLEFQEGKIWIDSKTYVVIAYSDTEKGDEVTIKYDLNVVTDEDVKEPNLEGYEKMN